MTNPTSFGTLPGGETAYLYTLRNSSGMSVTVSDFGGIITNVVVPDKNGVFADVVLAHDNFGRYLENPSSFGALIGRNANRINGAKLIIDDVTHFLPDTGGGNNAHGGPRGLSRRLFSAVMDSGDDGEYLTLSITIPHMDDGFPGELKLDTTYTLTKDNTLVINYSARADRSTIINLTNHSYFNLAGHSSGNIHDQTLWIDSDFYAANLPDGTSMGGIRAVCGTPLDFRIGKPIGQGISDECHGKDADGYNHFLFLNGTGYRRFAKMSDPRSGRVMEVFTDTPGVQIYSANNMPLPRVDKDGANYKPHQGMALETQFCPNSPNLPWLVSPICQHLDSTTAFKFSVDK